MIIEVTAHISSTSHKIEVMFTQGGRFLSRPDADKGGDGYYLTTIEATQLRDELTNILRILGK